MWAPPDPSRVEELRARAARAWARAGVEPSPQEISAAVARALDEDRVILPSAQREVLVQAVVDAALGLGPLEPVFRDPAVTEVMICGPARAYVERNGRIEPVARLFADERHLLHVIDRILAPLGRRVDESTPMADARLPDGSRVNVVVPPLAVDGPALTIRRFGRARLTAADLVAGGALDEPSMAALRASVRARRNVLVSGGTGSGKTTLMAALCEAIPEGERVVTIEDAAELRLPLPHVVRLEARPPSLEGAGAVTIRDLVRNALRMRPDRIIVGEVRGGEAIDMLAAMTTGHEGSLSTLHASSPDDALRRLRLMAMMGGLELPYAAVAEHVASAVDVIAHCERLPDGGRRVAAAVRVGRGGEMHDLRGSASQEGPV